MMNKKFVKSLYPTAIYNKYISFIEATEIVQGKERTYLLGMGKNEKHAWIGAAKNLCQHMVNQLER